MKTTATKRKARKVARHQAQAANFISQAINAVCAAQSVDGYGGRLERLNDDLDRIKLRLRSMAVANGHRDVWRLE